MLVKGHKWIVGYKGHYSVNKDGNVLSYRHAHGYKKPTLKKSWIGSAGYRFIGLCKNCQCESLLLHRVIAQAFIPNTENKPCVNHIDGVKTNNKILNLEWVTHKENALHAHANGLVPGTTRRRGKPFIANRKPITAYKDGNLVGIYSSLGMASELLGVSITSISNQLKERSRTAGGYTFNYQ